MDELYGAIQRAVASTKRMLIFGDSTVSAELLPERQTSSSEPSRNKLNEDLKTRRVWTIRSLDIMEIRIVCLGSRLFQQLLIPGSLQSVN